MFSAPGGAGKQSSKYYRILHLRGTVKAGIAVMNRSGRCVLRHHVCCRLAATEHRILWSVEWKKI
ncbi:hypothetical protein [Collimonas sp.]|jgi:hypothetical protein|uniref:hypothetical protein n=1 Tax=Collimonas sp. TaxID=1963772 RepID=UPI002D7F7616|nr:hypothetical protein [Collimonas sp.]